LDVGRLTEGVFFPTLRKGRSEPVAKTQVFAAPEMCCQLELSADSRNNSFMISIIESAAPANSPIEYKN